MTGKRARKSPTMEGEVDKSAAAAAATAVPSKTTMEESADAPTAVEGALTGGMRKSPTKNGGAPPKPESKERPRSNSIEGLLAAGTLPKEDAALASSVTNLMAAAVAAAAQAAAANGGPAAAEAGGVAKSSASTSKPNASKSNAKPKKTQITYHPDCAMTKEELTAWRREMTRRRNLESAAAGRRKFRDRMKELEEEVAAWKRRYQEDTARLSKAEKAAAVAAAAPAAAANRGPASAAAPALPTDFRKKAGGAAKSSASTSKPNASKSNAKPKQTRTTYHPDYPMTKEELTAWRREMTRRRSREAAAARQRKVRDRMKELEEEVAAWKRRYQEDTARLSKAEKAHKKQKTGNGEGEDEEDKEGGE